MYYLYRHIRLDKNEVFYIGIGKINTNYNTFKCNYQRAFAKKKSRNEHWKSIIAKTDYKVEIIFHCNGIEEIQEKEREFIKLYKNTLCNQTDGGLGIKSYKHTGFTKKRISETMKGRKLSEEHRKNINKRKNKSIIMFNDEQQIQFNSMTEAALYLGNKNLVSNISRYLKYKKAKVKGWCFKLQK